MASAVKVARELKAGQKCVVLLPDSVRNYMTKFLSDQWMADHEFIELESEPKQWWFGEKVSSMEMCAPLSVLPEITVEQTIEIMNSEGYDQLPVIDNAGAIQGVATLGSLKSKLLKGKVQPTDAVSKATYSTFKKVTLDTTLEKLDRILDREHFAFVVHSQRLYTSQRDVQTKEIIVGILTDIDLLNHVSRVESMKKSSEATSTRTGSGVSTPDPSTEHL